MVPVTDGSEQLTRAMQSLEAAFLIGLEGVTEIWLIRHADCYFEMSDRTDPPLSSIGRDQAARLAKRLERTGARRRLLEPIPACDRDRQGDRL